jgi:proteic killer suppression protein
VEVEFKTNELRECYENFERARRRWGASVGQRYIERVNILSACTSMADLGKIPQLKFHPLKGDRRGQYALTLDGQMRLLVSFKDRSRAIVRVEQVSKHYGD